MWIGRRYVFREVEIACGWLESTCLGMFVRPCHMEKLECREEKRWRQALRCERFDVTLFQDMLCLSITHEQVQEVLFPDCIARPDAGRQYEGEMWTLKGEAYGIAAYEGCGGGGLWYVGM